MAGGGKEDSLQYTPTWVVAIVCTVIVAISLVAERSLHGAGKFLLKRNQGSLFQALLKIKEELMLLGFISLMLVVFQTRIAKICISKDLTMNSKWLPCDRNKKKDDSVKATAHFRHLLAAASDTAGYCDTMGKAPLLTTTALHDLHIFIFVLAVSHVVFSVCTLLFGGLRIRQWKRWEESILKKEYDPAEEIILQAILLIRSVSKEDYTTLRLGFVMNHCRGNPKFNFYKYMTRALEKDFKKVVGISWYLWIFVVLFLLLNVEGWHAYFYISFIPLALLLCVGTKLEHIIIQLAREVAQKQRRSQEYGPGGPKFYDS